MTGRRVGWLSILAGTGLAIAVQALAPVGVPLYDGVVVQEPYRYLHPAAGQPGQPGSASVTEAVAGGVSPQIVAATTESPPQAQLIAQRDAFEIPVGAASVKASVSPVDAPDPPPEGRIVGNVYRFSVTDEAGAPLSPKPCEGCRSLVLRAPDDAGTARIMRYAAGAWSEVETLHGLGLFSTNPTALGDYALIEGPGRGADGPTDLTLVIVGAGIALLFFAVIGFLLLRARAPAPPARTDRPPGARSAGAGDRRPIGGRVPSKRRGSKRPPSGRSGT